MKKSSTHERGQALVIIAFAIIGLVAITALTIDGGNAYSDRRHAQNAADTAVLAAAVAKVRNPDSVSTWKEAGRQRAEDNQYVDSDYTVGTSSDRVNVEVYNCTDSASTCPEPYAGDPQYIQVKITSVVDTYFAPIIGVPTITNVVDAVARASEPEQDDWFDGAAMVSMKLNCPSGGHDNKDPFKLGGSSTSIVLESGVFVNSTCDPAFVQSGVASKLDTDLGVCVVGGSERTAGVDPPPRINCSTQKPANFYQGPPDAKCESAGEINKVEGKPKEYIAKPGYYNSNFPNVSPAGTLILEKGVYCLRNGFTLNANWFITTDRNNEFDPNSSAEQDPVNWHDSWDEGAFFVVEKGPVNINGGSKMALHAISTTEDNFPEKWVGYLFFVKDGSDVTLSGNSGSSYVGTILAPESHCVVQGAGGVLSLDTQIICYTNELTGNGNIKIQHTEENTALTLTNPGVYIAK